MAGHSEKEIKAIFDAFDTDGSGEISRRELVNALLQLYKGDDQKAKAVAYNVLKETDFDMNGKVSWNEFKNALA
ncbi:hypothetical protein LSH36_880g00038 [Paralvinella palmiformis]|uniref:EF-hand domain-containing protein n=1 Tax=Paralvinella palmiformis TaxID=53620 RepID=A0AAD9IYV6_9ANNE|nr:hypothetical protein LSH36_880g00038 [Paralvinella palmiformis]